MSGNVAFVIEGLGSGGAQRVVTTMSRLLVERGHRVHVVTYRSRSEDFFQLDRRVVRSVVPVPRLSRGPGVVRWMLRVIALRRILRAIPGRTVMAFILPTNVETLLATAGLGQRVVISERNDPVRQKLGLHLNLARWFLYRTATTVTANTRAAIEAMRPYVPTSRLRYLPNPIIPVRQHGAERTRPLHILAVGRLTPHKRHDVLLRALSLVRIEHPSISATIAGDGPSRRYLEELAQRVGVADIVEFAGAIKDISSLYARATVFVLTSRYEGAPNALLEAMATALPVIVSDASPGPVELVADGQAGLLVRADDENALAEALFRLARRPAFAAALGRAAQKRAQAFYPSCVVRQWEDVLELRP